MTTVDRRGEQLSPPRRSRHRLSGLPVASSAKGVTAPRATRPSQEASRQVEPDHGRRSAGTRRESRVVPGDGLGRCAEVEPPHPFRRRAATTAARSAAQVGAGRRPRPQDRGRAHRARPRWRRTSRASSHASASTRQRLAARPGQPAVVLTWSAAGVGRPRRPAGPPQSHTRPHEHRVSPDPCRAGGPARRRRGSKALRSAAACGARSFDGVGDHQFDVVQAARRRRRRPPRHEAAGALVRVGADQRGRLGRDRLRGEPAGAESPRHLSRQDHLVGVQRPQESPAEQPLDRCPRAVANALRPVCGRRFEPPRSVTT